MKKIFLFMVAALMSVTMLAGDNDLLWDYTEAAPKANPDNGLSYGAKVDDGEKGSNNRLNGVKLNNGGWAYFEKAAVAGKLKLTFANRKNETAYAVTVYNATKEADANPVKGTKIADTEDVEFGGSATIDLSADVKGVYIERKTSAEGVLSKIEFKEDVARSFVDFKIEFRDNPYTVLLPESGELPTGVLVENTSYNGGQHGIYGGKITVPVDGPVKFTIGACQFSGTPIAISKDGEKLLDFSNKIEKCGEQKPNYEQYVTYTYTGEAGTLTFELAGNTYVPYFFAEACDVTPCTITFKDQNGGVLGTVETIEGATLEAIPYTEADLPEIGLGVAFRGWFYMSDKKAKVGDPINGNTTIQAKVTPIEYVTVGSVQTYDFAKEIFYPEDHETVTATNGKYYNEHGWYFAADGSINVAVAGNAVVVVTLCKYSESGDVKVMAGEQELAKATVVKNETPDGTEFVAKYTGEATTLTINWTAKQYIHKVVVYNVEGFPEKDETTGYYMVPANDAAAFILTLVQAQEGDKIFLPNGLYDLGETVLTTISKNNLSIIGQSMDGVIIKNAPDAKTESIDKTATLKINDNIQNTYLQDLTIQNALDYYKADNGRAVCLWDRGNQTVCKNVKLLSYQDTYYSNKAKTVKYFEDCEIHGTVDFICGDGSVYFKNNLLYAEKRKKDGGGQDALTASNADALDKGYVFEGCTLKSECPTVSFGRAWNNTPQVAFLNTIVDYSAGEFSFESSDGKIQRWTKELMNSGAWPQFVEYNTRTVGGELLTPASNEVTFVDTKAGASNTYETVISAEGAALRTMEYTLGEWAATAKADATQAVCEKEWSDLDPNAVYMAEEDGVFVMLLKGSEINQLMVYDGKTYTLRKANARGGFGLPAGEDPEGVENTAADTKNGKVQKIFRNGHVVIIRDGKEYNALGIEL